MLAISDIRELLDKPISRQTAEPEGCIDWVDSVNRRYRELIRHQADPAVLVDLKLNLVFWRARLTHHLLSDAGWAGREPAALTRILGLLGSYLHPPQQSRLAATLDDPERCAEALAHQGVRHEDYPRYHAVAGPGMDINIVANRGSGWSFDKWSRRDTFSEYEFDGDGVRYRGVLFRPGDVLLTNVNLDGNGLYTSLADPKAYCSHSAFFAILEDRGRRFPVVVETYEKGVRPVPLNVFLGPRFSAYAEVYRHQELGGAHTTAINRIASDIITRVRGYNFDSEDPNQDYMSCTSVGRFLHQAAGLSAARTISALKHPRIQRNLSKLGYTYFEFFAPVDYLLNECFTCVGWVDNNQTERLVAQELVDRRFRQLFSERELLPDKFPFPAALNRWGLRHMRQRTLIGRIIGYVEGFDHVSLPKGPDDLLAVIKLAERQLGRAIVQTRQVVEHKLREADEIDLEALQADAAIETVLRRTLDFHWLPA